MAKKHGGGGRDGTGRVILVWVFVVVCVFCGFFYQLSNGPFQLHGFP